MIEDVITNILLFVVIGGILVLIGFYFAIIRQFKYKVRVKELCNNRMIVTDVKAKEHVDKEKNKTWYLQKFKKNIPIPSNDVIEIDNKGKKLVEIYLTETGEVFYAKDVVKLKEIPEEILTIKDEEERIAKKKEWLEKNKNVTPYEPFSSDNRYFLIQQTKKAEAMRKKSLMENLPVIASIMGMVIIIVMLMIFWGDIAEPAIKGQEMQAQNLAIMERILDKQIEIEKGVQIIHSEAKIEPLEDGETGLSEPPN